MWTDWFIPAGYAGSQQDWTHDMMGYWAQANSALDRGDMTWASRQPIQVPDSQASVPEQVVTLGDAAHGGEISVWDPIGGERLRRFGADSADPNVALATGPAAEAGSDSPRVVTVTARGVMRVYDAAQGQLVKSVRLSLPEGRTAARIAVREKGILVYPSDGTAALAFDAAGAPFKDPAAERRLVGSFVAGETVGLDVRGSCARVYDLAGGKTTKFIDVDPSLRSMAVADVDAVPGNELVTLNAGTVKFWDGPSGAKLLSFPVGHEMVAVAAGR